MFVEIKSFRQKDVANQINTDHLTLGLSVPYRQVRGKKAWT